MRKAQASAKSRDEKPGTARGRLSTAALRNGRMRFGRPRKRPSILRPDDLVALVSHELRTPLTALRLQLDTAIREVKKAEVSRETLTPRLEAAKKQADRLMTLVDQLLDASRLSLGKLRLEIEPVDWMHVVRDVVDQSSELLARAQCPVEVHGPPSVTGMWNRLALEQALFNLLANACKFGRGRPIRIELEADERRARMRISDGGIGIAPADQARIFHRYEQVTDKKRPTGLGLGLWIVERIVTALDGHVRVESRLGQGATFVVDLPRSRPNR